MILFSLLLFKYDILPMDALLCYGISYLLTDNGSEKCSFKNLQGFDEESCAVHAASLTLITLFDVSLIRVFDILVSGDDSGAYRETMLGKTMQNVCLNIHRLMICAISVCFISPEVF